MKNILNMENLFSSDILLYDELVKVQEDNPVLEEHTLSFPSESKLKSENAGIFIGHGKNVLRKQTSHSHNYDNQVRAVITNKNTDYKVAKTAMDLAVKELLRTILESDLGNQQFRWTESQTVHNSQHGIKYRTLNMVFGEQYSWEKSDYDKRDLKLLFCDPVIDDSDIKEESRADRIRKVIDEIQTLKSEGVDLLPYILNDSIF